MKNTDGTNLRLSPQDTSVASTATPTQNALKSDVEVKKSRPVRHATSKTKKAKEPHASERKHEIPQPTVNTDKVKDTGPVPLIYDKLIATSPLFDFSGVSVERELRQSKQFPLSALGPASKRLLTFDGEPGKQNVGATSIKAILLQNTILSELDLNHQTPPKNVSNGALGDTLEKKKEKKYPIPT